MESGLRVAGSGFISQRLQYPLLKYHTLNHIRDPFYNLRYISLSIRDIGVSGCLGSVYKSPFRFGSRTGGLRGLCYHKDPYGGRGLGFRVYLEPLGALKSACLFPGGCFRLSR